MTDKAHFIEGFDHRVRLHSKLDNLSPNALSCKSAVKHPIVVSEKT